MSMYNGTFLGFEEACGRTDRERNEAVDVEVVLGLITRAFLVGD
jgi:hypothetical protein